MGSLVWLFWVHQAPRGGLSVLLFQGPGTSSGGWHELAVTGRVGVQQILGGKGKRRIVGEVGGEHTWRE